MMYYGNIKKYDIADGEGVRVSLFVSGCTNACPHCFQPETWDFHYGQPYTKDTEEEILTALDHPFIAGLTILGGDPMELENQRGILELCRRTRRKFPDKTIWAYTGFILEEDLLLGGRRHCEVTDELLSLIDVLVDGPFVEAEKDITLRFRGSANQRVLDLPKTMAEERPVLYLT